MKQLEKKSWWCPSCSHAVATSFKEEWNRVCPYCGGTIIFRAPTFPTWNHLVTDLPGIWRYFHLLPLFSREHVIPLGEGSSVPIESKRLAQRLGVHKLSFLTQSANPTGTFKDLEASFMIAKCQEWRENRLCWHSTGNTARAYRHYALHAKDMSTTSFYPLNCAYKWRGATRANKALLFAYDGPFQHLSKLAKDYAQKNHMLHIAPLAWKIEGKSAIAYKICETAPATTLIIQTIAGGYGILGIAMGYERLREVGLFTGPVPRFGLFQLAGVDTIAKLYQEDIKEITGDKLLLLANPFEPTLQSTNPMSTYKQVRHLLRQNDSFIQSVAVPDIERHAPELEQACQELAIPLSYEQEKSPFISWAGLVQSAEQGLLYHHDEIVFIVSGGGNEHGEIPVPDQVLTSSTCFV